MARLKKSQRSLRSWTKQDWGTKSGKKSSETGERYLPKAARDALSSAEYANQHSGQGTRKYWPLLLDILRHLEIAETDGQQ